MNRHAPKPLASGFTLVELLVVISIVSLLISILLPVLASARLTAQRLKCMSQLRSLAPAVSAYAGDNRGYGPPHTFEQSTSSPQIHPHWAYGRPAGDGRAYFTGLDAYFGYDAGSDITQKFYYRDKGCPDYRKGVLTNDIAFTMNHWMLGLWQPGNPVPVAPSNSRNGWISLDARYVRASSTMIGVESNRSELNESHITPSLLYTRTDKPRATGGYDHYGRHKGKGLNFLYVDGHAAFLGYNGANFETVPIFKPLP